MRTTLMNRDLDDVAAGVAHNVHVLDVQNRPADSILSPSTWGTIVLENDHGTKVVIRQHRLTGAMRIKAIPAKTVDLLQPEPYEIELLPDVPFPVVINLLEILK
jgi:hypothetical protein